MKSPALLKCIFLVFAVPQTMTAEAQDLSTAFERSFRQNFRESSIRNCVQRVDQKFKASIDLNSVCTCMTDGVLSSSTVSELMRPIDDAKVTPIFEKCFRDYLKQ